MAPIYSELSERFPVLMFLMIDVDEMPDFSSSWDIRVTPTLFFLRDGKPFDKLVGAKRTGLEKKVMELARSKSEAQWPN